MCVCVYELVFEQRAVVVNVDLDLVVAACAEGAGPGEAGLDTRGLRCGVQARVESANGSETLLRGVC